MTTEENKELINLLSRKEQELRQSANKGTVSSGFISRHADMAKELAEFLKMFEKNKRQ